MGTETLTDVGGTEVAINGTSAWGPTHATSTDHVEVEVGHAVSCVVAHVEHQPVATRVDAVGPGDCLGGGHHLGQQGAVRCRQHIRTGDVFFRHDKDVGGGGRTEVTERERGIGLEYQIGGDVTGHDVAEQTVAHVGTVLSTVRRVADGPVDIDALLADLSRWTGDQIVDEATRSRTRERWLRQQQHEGATFGGLVLDLVELGAEVTVRTTSGRTHAGGLSGAGPDFIVVRTRGGAPTFIALSAVAFLRPPPGHRLAEAASDRELPGGASLTEVVITLAVDRPRVQVVTAGADDVITGDLRSVGTDVVTIRLDGDGATGSGNLYVRLDTITELTLLG